MFQWNFDYDVSLLKTMVGGDSSLDAPRLYVENLEEAYAFLKSYGFDIHDPKQEKRTWYFHMRALSFLREKILDKDEEIPDIIADPKQLKDIRNLLVWASQKEFSPLRRWSCAVLRVAHVFVHAENDLFSYYAEEVQRQILGPIQACVVHEGERVFLKHPFSSDEVTLKAFEVKPFKTSSSEVLKMLAKPEVVALKVLDKIGVRFITRSLFDAFQVALFLADRHLVNFAHVIPDQSSNNLYPLPIFLSTLKELCDLRDQGNPVNFATMNQLLNERWTRKENQEGLIRKENLFSDSDYRFIKFICRKLITVNREGAEPFSFFYPFEVQIVDEASYLQNQSGPSNHALYKERQRQAARQRLFPDLVLEPKQTAHLP
ncbi:MAG: hypothetical protein RJB66_318 [Pseudomonadota bacterium]|jgi:uncharacterized protein (TIGR04562 family)